MLAQARIIIATSRMSSPDVIQRRSRAPVRFHSPMKKPATFAVIRPAISSLSSPALSWFAALKVSEPRSGWLQFPVDGVARVALGVKSASNLSSLRGSSARGM